jgi:hypothetical protein
MPWLVNGSATRDRETLAIEHGVMEFDSKDTRDEYFKRIEANLTVVEYGAALRHASTTGLGFFGSEDDLFDDCSRIMLAEVRKFACRKFCRLCDVQLCIVWHVIYNSARAKPRREMAIVYRELGQANDNKALLEEAAMLKTPVWLSDTPPYQSIYEDIKRKGLIPNAISGDSLGRTRPDRMDR